MKDRRFWMVLAIAIGLLQAWDSGAFDTGAGPALLALAGVLVPAVGIGVTALARLHVVMVLVGAALLTSARMVSPVALNTLHLALMPVVIYLVVSRVVRAPAETVA